MSTMPKLFHPCFEMIRYTLVSWIAGLFAATCAAGDAPLAVTAEARDSARAFFQTLQGDPTQIMLGNALFQLAVFEGGKYTQQSFIPNGKTQLPTYLAAHPICVRNWQLTKQFKYPHSEFSFDWALLGTLELCDGSSRYFEITTDAKRRFYRSFAMSDQESLMLGRYR